MTETVDLLIFYDWTGRIDVEAWASLALEFFDRIGIKPNLAEYVRDDNRYGKVKPKNLSTVFSKYTVIGASLTSIDSESTDSDKFTANCDFKASETNRAKRASFCYVSSSMDMDLLIGLSQNFVGLVGEVYGIGLRFPISSGPRYFVSDIVFSPTQDWKTAEHSERKRSIQNWLTERFDYNDGRLAQFRHLRGMLRDVYPLNILTLSHLKRRVGCEDLQSWIYSSDEHGFLEQISLTSWAWIVPTSLIVNIKNHLKANDILIND